MTSTATAAVDSRPSVGRPLAWAFAIVCLGVSLVRGFAKPNPWAGAQLAFTCDIAPKRCVIGQALSLLHVPVRTLEQFHTLGLLMLAAAIVAFVAAAWTCRLVKSSEGVVAMGALAASYGFSMFVANVGFLDVVMAILASICLIVPDRWRAAATFACVAAGVLVHEGFLIIFLPVLLLPLVLANPSPKGLLWPVAIAAAALLLVLSLALHKPLSEEQGLAAWRQLQSRVDYPVPYDTIHVLTRSLADNLRLMLALSKTHGFQMTQLGSLAILLPILVVFADLVVHGSPAPPWAKALAILCALSPLAMNLLGYDVVRWVGLCSLTMFLALAALARRYGPPRLRSPRLFAMVAILLSVTPLAFPRPWHGAGGTPEMTQITNTL
jgi:hypothetical protein